MIILHDQERARRRSLRRRADMMTRVARSFWHWTIPFLCGAGLLDLKYLWFAFAAAALALALDLGADRIERNLEDR